MELSYVIQSIISSMCVAFFMTYNGYKMFFKKIKINFISLFMLVILTLLITINYLFLDNIARTSFAYTIVLIAYMVFLKKPILQCAITSFISCVQIALGEVLFIGFFLILNFFGVSLNTNNLGGNVLANLIIVLFSILTSLIIYKPVNKLLNKIKEHNKITLIITFMLFVTVNCTLFYKLYFHEYQFDKYLLFNLFLLIALAYIAFILIKQQYDKSRISDEYERFVEYSKHSERLVDQYSISQHENKNELIIIKSMVNKNNKELLEYLNEIISSKDNIDEAWIRYLRYLPFGGLKGIIHNKISDMKDHGINVFLDISKNIGNCNLKRLTVKENNQLFKIIGVFLDNAKEAAILSKDKEVSVCVYLDNKEVVFEISNTYANEIDLSKIYNIGASTKGKGRGYGLALVDSIIKENKIFKNEVKKIDNYFVQILRINI